MTADTYMASLRLTQKMKEALERLYETNGQADFVNMTTAFALENRGLVSISESHRRTAGGQFPEYMTALSNNGRKWCERHFANLRSKRKT